VSVALSGLVGVMNPQDPLDEHEHMKMVTNQNLLTTGAPVTGEDLSGEKVADQGRRRFMKLNLLGLALAPTASLLVGETAWAAGRSGRAPKDMAVLDPADPQAKALHYTPDSSKEGQSCSDCQLYTGTAGEDYGPCAIFSYRVAPSGEQIMVSAAGWCRSWGPRQPV
jgi:hypothetical protein